MFATVFAQSFSDQVGWSLIVVVVIAAFWLNKLKQWDKEGEVKKAATGKVIGTLLKWLKK